MEQNNNGLVKGYYNTPTDPAFITALGRIHELARKREVCYGLNYGEAQDQWYFTVSSMASCENFVGKDRLLSFAVEDVIEHLENLGKGNGAE